MPADPLAELRARIQATFGFDALRPLQAEAMAASLAGRDALVVLPTGGGKSLCYQAPALVRPGFTIVVSPLIALMADQLRALEGHGVAAGAFNSGQDPKERDATWERLRRRELQLVYCSPERIVAPGFYATLLAHGASAIAVDEAHCISHWGHDFRPEYRMLGGLRSEGRRLPILALTATATPRVQDDIVAQLGLVDEVRLVGDFDRPNLTYRITQRSDQVEDVLAVVRRHAGQCGIVYVLRRKDTESLAAALAKRGVRCEAYHAGLEADERRRVQERFQSERVDVVVATVAFGMGIDRSDVRFVVHATLPKGIEQYSQETGRAGRDGLPAECVMFYSGADFHGWRSLMQRSTEEAKQKCELTAQADLELYAHEPAQAARIQGQLVRDLANLEGELAQSIGRLEKLWSFASGTSCRHRFLVEHFGGTYQAREQGCGACDVCLGELVPVADSQVIAQKILSCVVHCRQSYGASHVANVLRGAKLAKLSELGHDRFTTFGLLADHDTTAVRAYIDQLVARGHLIVSAGQYPTLALSSTGVAVMRGTLAVEFFRARAPARASKEPTGSRRRPRGASALVPRARGAAEGSADDLSGAPAAPLVDDPGVDHDLIEELRELRRRLARERAVPPYLLFNDRTLVDLVEKRPRSRAELLDVVGIGEKKANDLGDLLLAALAAHDRAT
jgi:ATP-dependent DNA helicase RecQ